MDIDKLLQSSPVVSVANTSDFLKTFTNYNFSDPKKLKIIQQILTQSVLLTNQGAVGEVYKYDKNYIIKITRSCPSQGNLVNTPIVYQMCLMAQEGSFIFRIPQTFNSKTMMYGPNYIFEPLIGIMLQKLARYTPSFMIVYDFLYDQNANDKPAYSISESLSPLSDYIRTDYDYFYMIFQISYALYVAQRTMKYNHFDLHSQNIMARPKNKKQITVYPLDNGNYLYTLFDFDSVIIDYGFNRLETNDDILMSRGNLILGTKTVQDYYFFNPYYDVFTLVNHNLLSVNNSPSATQQIKNIALQLATTYSHTSTEEELVNFFKYTLYPQNVWRPIPENLASTSMPIGKASTPYEMMINMCNLLPKEIKNPEIKDPEKEIPTFLETNKFMISDKLFTVDGEYTLKVYPSVPKKQVLDTTYYNYNSKNLAKFDLQPKAFKVINDNTGVATFDTTPKPYHYTMPPGSNQENQKIHIVIIDPEIGKEKGYNFEFECCRIDIKNYFQQKEIKAGVAINAAFFNISNNFSPVGYFKTDNFISTNEVPDFYAKYYNIVGINDRGELYIDEIKNKDKYQKVITTGPLLVKNGVQIINEKTLSDPELQCSNDPKDNVHLCNDIKPGELYHGSNLNPRSAIGIMQDGKVMLIYVEGRETRGAGMDLSQLASFCIKSGCKDAINLDGGRSSQIMWRNMGEKIINIANPTQTDTYPVGSIISYIKK